MSMINATPQDSLDDIFGDIGHAIQNLRLQIQMANQQYSDVKHDTWTLGNAVARWNTMSPESQQNAIVFLAIAGYVLIKLAK